MDISNLEQRLSAEVNSYMSVHNLTALGVARKAYNDLGLSVVVTGSYVRALKHGQIHSGQPFIIPTPYEERLQSPKYMVHLERHAYILHKMKVPEDHPIIAIIKELDPRFVYPPNMESIRARIELNQLLERLPSLKPGELVDLLSFLKKFNGK